MNTIYHSITSLNRLGTVQLFQGDAAMPYVERDGQYYYFVLVGKDYHLAMIATKDLQQERGE